MSRHLPPKLNKHEKEPEPSILNTSLREQSSNHIIEELNVLSKSNYAVCGLSFLLLFVGLVLGEDTPAGMVSLCLSYLCTAYHVLLRAVNELRGLKLLENNLLLLLASVGLLALAHYRQAALLLLCYRLIRLSEGYFEQRGKMLRAEYASHLPQEAHLVKGGSFREIEPDEISLGDILEVRPNETVPVDGVIIEGNSAMDVSAFTGGKDSFPVGVDRPVLCGCINVGNTIRIRATESFASSASFIILQQLEKAGRYRSKVDKFYQRFEHYFTPSLFLAALLCAAVVPLFCGEWFLWLERACMLMSLVALRGVSLSIRNGYCAALIWAKRRGIIFKGYCFFEELSKAKTFVFNKTGTLTEGKYVVSDVVPNGIEEEELLHLAAHAESGSTHPIARAICSAYGLETESGATLHCEEFPGRGVVAVFNGKEIFVGNAAHLAEHGVICETAKKGGTAIHVAVNKSYAGYLLVSDRTREAAFDQLEMLRIQGVENMVTLTSDLHSVARPLAASLNMDMIRAELSTEGKISAVEYLAATKAEHSSLAYVCNGGSDAPVLQRADVGISLGAAGNGAAMEHGDVLIMDHRLGAIAESLGISRFVTAVVQVNVMVGVFARLLLVLLSVLGVVQLDIAAPLMVILCLLVNFNSLRVLKYDNDAWRKYR